MDFQDLRVGILPPTRVGFELPLECASAPFPCRRPHRPGRPPSASETGTRPCPPSAVLARRPYETHIACKRLHIPARLGASGVGMLHPRIAAKENRIVHQRNIVAADVAHMNVVGEEEAHARTRITGRDPRTFPAHSRQPLPPARCPPGRTRTRGTSPRRWKVEIRAAGRRTPHRHTAVVLDPRPWFVQSRWSHVW